MGSEQGLHAGAWTETAWLGLVSGWGWAYDWGLVGAGAWAGSIGWGWEQGLELGMCSKVG